MPWEKKFDDETHQKSREYMRKYRTKDKNQVNYLKSKLQCNYNDIKLFINDKERLAFLRLYEIYGRDKALTILGKSVE